MVRILFLLMIVLFSNAKIATAKSDETVAQSSCTLQSGSFQESLTISPQQNNNVIALSHNNPMISRRLVSHTSEPKLETAEAELKSENSFDPAISSNTKSSRANTTSNTNQEQTTIAAGISFPSLWWAKEQFDPFGGKLISSWLTYPQIKQIDLTVNWQLWTLLDYLGRYRFINQFGTVAREYGYNLRIFNQQKQCLAYYEYNNQTNPPKWEINIEGIGEDSLQIEQIN